MKNFYCLLVVLIITLLCLSLPVLFAQPTGANISNPINAGILGAGASFTDTRNNSPANGYGNDIGQPSDDIYYQFTLNGTAEVSLSHCSSGLDTYMHLLNSAGSVLASNDDNAPVFRPAVIH